MITIISGIGRYTARLLGTLAGAVLGIGINTLALVVLTWIGMVALRVADSLSGGVVLEVGATLRSGIARMWQSTSFLQEQDDDLEFDRRYR